jgi:hypothetical protein
MKIPEASQPLDLGFLAKLMNRLLLEPVGQRKFGHAEQLDQLESLHHVVLLDAAILGVLLQLNEGHCGVLHSGYDS